jgi:putative restriction endonuclease
MPDADELDDPGADRIIIGPTFREQVIRARRGQGVFRSNVLLREEYCRVTKVHDGRHLKASHIKPWRDASDTERLDGSNGLLLSPHIDHLFDEGYVTFSNRQELLVLPEVKGELLDAWGIDEGVNVGEFSREQNGYLDYHRANVFKGRR